jgi:hypothetical protein
MEGIGDGAWPSNDLPSWPLFPQNSNTFKIWDGLWRSIHLGMENMLPLPARSRLRQNTSDTYATKNF